MAYYRHDNDHGLVKAATVIHRDYQLEPGTHAAHEYPVGDWYWFASDEEARAHFGLESEDE